MRLSVSICEHGEVHLDMLDAGIYAFAGVALNPAMAQSVGESLIRHAQNLKNGSIADMVCQGRA